MESRKLLAQLVWEEALETIQALGFKQGVEGIEEDSTLCLYNIIDGACGLIYVATGVLAGCGVPDNGHLREVCEANDEKFPDGIAKINPDTGKYLKPEGWIPPDHQNIREWNEERIKKQGPEVYQNAMRDTSNLFVERGGPV
jgi:predicted HAD superfamily Cof-like phosphohydrolase